MQATGAEEELHMKVYLVVELHKGDVPRIIGLYRSKKDAEAAAYGPDAHTWRNVIPLKVL